MGLKGVGIVLVIVILFTVVPELIHFGSDGSSKQSSYRPVSSTDQEAAVAKNKASVSQNSSDATEQQLEVTKVEESPKSAKRDTLAKIEMLLDDGYLDRLRDQRVKDLTAERPAQAELLEQPQTQQKSILGTSDKKRPVEAIDVATLSWKTIKSDPLRKMIVEAKKGSIALARSVDSSKRLTRMALLDYATGLTTLVQSGDGALNIQDVPAYVARLERDVAGAMYYEKLDREDLNKFSKLAISPVFTSGGRAPLVPAVETFDPQLTITLAEVKQRSGPRGRYDPRGKATVKLSGYVVGKNIRSMSVIRNGIFFKLIKPGKADAILGQRQFKLSNLDARSSYLFVVEDKDGQQFTKRYSFLDRAQEYKWYHRSPTGNDQYFIPFSEGDRRFDLLFAAHSARSSRAGEGGQGNIEFGPIDGLVAF